MTSCGHLSAGCYFNCVMTAYAGFLNSPHI